MIQTIASVPTFNESTPGESSRFLGILHKHVKAKGSERGRLRDVLSKYVEYSPESDKLIDDLISECVELKSEDRLDIAIDVLSSVGNRVYDYAKRFRLNDIRNWSKLYPRKEYEPNDDYWHILLRAVAQSEIEDQHKLYLIGMCFESSRRGVLEGVVEALADVDTPDAKVRLEHLAKHEDPFIAELASDLL